MNVSDLSQPNLSFSLHSSLNLEKYPLKNLRTLSSLNTTPYKGVKVNSLNILKSPDKIIDDQLFKG